MSLPVLYASSLVSQARMLSPPGTSSNDLNDPTTATFAASSNGASVTAGAIGTVGLLPVGPWSGGGTVLTVGVGEEYATIAAAVAAAQSGDTILVQAGTYTNDFFTVSTDITLVGVGGMVNLVATEPPPNLKGIATIDADCTIENFTFTGCAIAAASGNNGAGVRYEGGNLVLQNCGFFNNQDGILGSAVLGLASNTITVTNCVFDGNGAGDGQSHNIYIGTGVETFTMTNSISENAVVGHEVKSRAAVNIITNNLIQETGTGNASYSIDLPNGGVSTISGNTIIQGPDSQNPAILHFGGEGFPYADSSLTITDNDIVNQDTSASASALLNQTLVVAQMSGNVVTGLTASQLAVGPVQETDDFNGSGSEYPDSGSTAALPSNVTIISLSAPTTVTLSQNSTGIEGGGGLLTVLDYASVTTVIGGSGGVVASELGSFQGQNVFIDAAGSNNTIAAYGADQIESLGTDLLTLGTGNAVVMIGGTATVYAGSGNSGFAISGTASLVGAGGADTINLGSGASASVGGALAFIAETELNAASSFDLMNTAGELAFAVDGGSAGLTGWGDYAAITTGGGGQGAQIVLAAGIFNVMSEAADTIFGGGGTDTVILTGGELVYAGSGSMSVYGRGIATGATVFGSATTLTLSGDTGRIDYVAPSVGATLVDDLSNCSITGGAGVLTVQANGGDLLVNGGAGGIDFLDHGGADTIRTAAGSVNLLSLLGASQILSQGSDLIEAGSGNQNMTLAGAASVTGGTGNDNYLVTGQALLDSAGNDWVTVSGGGSAAVTAPGYVRLAEVGGTAMVTDGAGNGVVTLSGGAATMVGNAGSVVQINTAAAAQIVLGADPASVTSNAADNIQLGSGAATVSIGAANTSVAGGGGAATLHVGSSAQGFVIAVNGGSTALTTYSSGSLQMNGGSASVTAYAAMTVQAGSGNLTLTGNGVDSVAGGSGSAQVMLASGAATVTDGPGNLALAIAAAERAVTLNFVAGMGGSEVVSGFRAGTDQVSLQGVSVAAQSISGGNTFAVLSDGTRVELVGAAVALHD